MKIKIDKKLSRDFNAIITKKNIKSVGIYWGMFMGMGEWRGNIEYRRGHLTAKQAFENKSFEEMIQEMQEFIEFSDGFKSK